MGLSITEASEQTSQITCMKMKSEYGSSLVVLQNSFSKDVFEQTQPPKQARLQFFAWFCLFAHTICYVIPYSLIWEGVEFTVPNVSHGAMICYRL